MIALDASVLIAHVSSSDVHHAAATEVLLSATPGSMLVHPLTLTEVLVGGVRAGRAAALRDDLFAAGVVLTHPDIDEPLRLAELCVSTGMRLPACCVLAVALHHHTPLATFDEGLARTARRLGLRALP